MSNSETAFSHTVKKLIGLMLVMIAVAAIIGFYQKGPEFTLALLYGGAITVTSAVFFAWRLRIATRSADTDDQSAASGVNAAVLFQAIVLRLVMIIVLLALGMSWLKLNPLGMVIGFTLPLIAYWFSADSYGKTRRQ